jgi:predicted ATPase
MSALPGGTVTFLFTDIEGSTRLLQELGSEAYARSLAEHRRMLRNAFAAHGGVEVDTQGDAFFVAFADAGGALAAAERAQRELVEGSIQVRMGLHTGEPLLTDEGYVGVDVHRAARVAAAGHGGQVLVSADTAVLVGADGLLDLGEHRLKDFAEPVSIFQVGDEAFPPLKTISNTNLPRPASSFVGREREVEEVLASLRDGSRLLTLTGPGGSGKTRLAIEAASELVPEFKAGVFWVGLATVRDPRLVPDTIALTLGAKDGLAEHVGERELLLLLDNIEQVVEAAPQLATLVESCPNLRLLVTSRELLRVRGEVEYPVLPLAEPEGVELFCARAQTDPDEAVHELCVALDNLPLALELAAARTSVLSPRQILERLSQRLDLLKGGRDADPRQQTLRATIEWSYELLPPEEQHLFARLAVFGGGCTLEAARQVAGADVDTLQSLVDKSLVRHTEERFWMLETIREYAVERLDQMGEADELRQRHAEWYLALAEHANLSAEALERGEQRQELVLPEQPNLRDAIDWALGAGNVELAGQLVVASEMLWVTQNPFEGMRRPREVLDAGGLSPGLEARVLRSFGSSADPAGEFGLAETAYAESLSIFRQLGDEKAIAHMLLRLGSSALKRGDLKSARSLLEESLERNRAVGNKTTEAQVLTVLGSVAWEEGEREMAIELVAQGVAVVRDVGFAWWEAVMSGTLAEYTFELGRTEESERWARQELQVAHRISERQLTVWGLAQLAVVAAAQGNLERAGLLWGAIEAEESNGPVGAWELERGKFEEMLLAKANDEYEQGGAAGRAMSLAEAVEQALADA